MKCSQLDMFKQDEGKRLADAGLNLAVDTANTEHPGWAERCWQLFWQWLNKKPMYFEFMIEDFREYLNKYDLLEKPKSDRAFGFISKKAVSRGLIELSRIVRVKNKKAHCANAALWIKR